MNGNRAIPPHPRLEDYHKQAKDLIQAFKSGDRAALRRIRRYHPRLPGRPDTNDRNEVTDTAIRKS